MSAAHLQMAVDLAIHEVLAKSAAEIEAETAFKWASRAAACYRLYYQTRKASWIERATDYSHEALEHAAMVCDGGATLLLIEHAMAEERSEAKRDLR